MAKKESKIYKVTREFGLSTLAVDNRTSVVILTLIIAFWGVYSYISMPKESYPEINIPTIYIGTVYPGNSPADMENLITRPIEKELKSLKNVEEITSNSVQDFSTILVEFSLDTDQKVALQEVKDAVDKANSELPTDLDSPPNVAELDFSALPVMNINLAGDYSVDELKLYAEYLEDEFEKLRGVSKAEIKGALEREIRIDADLHLMESKNVSFNDIAGAIGNENLTISGGSLRDGDFRRDLRIMGEFETVDQIQDVIVKSEKGNIVYLRDVAKVSDAFAERESFASSAGLPLVSVDIIKRSGENLLNTAVEIKAIIAEAQADRFPEDLEVTITNDQSKATQFQVDNLENSIIFGVILVVLILTFFLGLRNAMFVGLAIPLSMFLGFMLFSFMGVSLNLMVLFSLILALGLLVDNGIVVIENIYRLVQEGYSLKRAAKEGVGEVALPIITSTATTLLAFLPLVFWQDIMGEFMKYLPITLIVVLSSSLFVALVINPVLTSLFMKLEKKGIKNRKRLFMVSFAMILVAIVCFFLGSNGIGNLLMLFAVLGLINLLILNKAVFWFQDVLLVALERFYSRVIAFSLQKWNKYLIFFGTILLLFASIFLMTIFGPKVVFFPVNEPNYVNIFIQKPLGTDIQETQEFTAKVEQAVQEVIAPYGDLVESVITNVGAGTSDPMTSIAADNSITPHKAKITVSFVMFQHRNGVNTNDVTEELRQEVKKYPGAVITIGKEVDGPPVGAAIAIQLTGENYEELIQLSDNVIGEINSKEIPGIERLQTDLELGKPELLVKIDRDKARRFGLSTGQVANELRTALFGLEVSKFKDGEDDYPIQLRLKDEQRYSTDYLLDKKITFQDKQGKMKSVPISSVANFETSSTFGSVKRSDLDRSITISSNVLDGFNGTEINDQIRSTLENYDFPTGFEYNIGGEQEEQAKSMAFLGRAFIIAIACIFMVLVAQFNSFITPFIIVASVAFSTIGVFLGLIIFQMDFVVIMTGIGLVSLAGIVVNNAIVLIDYINLVRQRQRARLNLDEDDLLPKAEVISSIIEAGQTRLRPVLLTAITTVLGLIPLAIGLNINFFSLFTDFDPQFFLGGDNTKFYGPMAWTVIFGLVFATFLTLIVVPIMYLFGDQLKYKFSSKKEGSSTTNTESEPLLT